MHLVVNGLKTKPFNKQLLDEVFVISRINKCYRNRVRAVDNSGNKVNETPYRIGFSRTTEANNDQGNDDTTTF